MKEKNEILEDDSLWQFVTCEYGYVHKIFSVNDIFEPCVCYKKEHKNNRKK